MLYKHAMPNCGIAYLSGIQSYWGDNKEALLLEVCKATQGPPDAGNWEKAGYNLLCFTCVTPHGPYDGKEGDWLMQEIPKRGLGNVVCSDWTLNWIHKNDRAGHVRGYLFSVNREAVVKYLKERMPKGEKREFKRNKEKRMDDDKREIQAAAHMRHLDNERDFGPRYVVNRDAQGNVKNLRRL